MAKKDEATKKVTLLSRVEHDGEKYGEGDEIELPGSQADALVKSGAAKEKASKAEKAESDKK